PLPQPSLLLFPYTTLFRSRQGVARAGLVDGESGERRDPGRRGDDGGAGQRPTRRICRERDRHVTGERRGGVLERITGGHLHGVQDRKSTRLNSVTWPSRMP